MKKRKMNAQRIITATANNAEFLKEVNKLKEALKFGDGRFSYKENINEISRCLLVLRSLADSNKTYPLKDKPILNIYRHDELSLFTKVRRVHYTYEDMTDCESQNINKIQDLCLQLANMIERYHHEFTVGKCDNGAGVDVEGWSVEMISEIYGNKLYPIKFIIYYMDFDNPRLNRDFVMTPDEVYKFLEEMSR